MGTTEGGGPPSGRRPSPLAYAGLGFELVVPILLGVFGGRWLDARWETSPWMLIGGAMLGLVVGFYSFLRTILALGKSGATTGEDER